MMKLEELDPPYLQDLVHLLKHGSNTIECEISDALESANTTKEFRASVKLKMKDLITEARNTIFNFS